jgi:hypothetical protein
LPNVPLNITVAVQHVKNQHINFINAIDDDVLTDRKTSQSGPQIVSEATYVRIAGEEGKTVSDRINNAISDFYAAAFFS